MAKRSVHLKAVLLRHPAILHCDQAILNDFERNLVLNLFDLEAGRGLNLDDEPFHLVIREIARPDDRNIAPGRVADPLFLTVDDPGISLPLRGRGQAARCAGAYERLGQTEAADLIEARHLHGYQAGQQRASAPAAIALEADAADAEFLDRRQKLKRKRILDPVP